MCLEQIKKTNDHEMHEITQQGQAFTKSHLQFSFLYDFTRYLHEIWSKNILEYKVVFYLVKSIGMSLQRLQNCFGSRCDRILNR